MIALRDIQRVVGREAAVERAEEQAVSRRPTGREGGELGARGVLQRVPGQRPLEQPRQR